MCSKDLVDMINLNHSLKFKNICEESSPYPTQSDCDDEAFPTLQLPDSQQMATIHLELASKSSLHKKPEPICPRCSSPRLESTEGCHITRVRPFFKVFLAQPRTDRSQ